MASCVCVLPILTISLNSCYFARRPSVSFLSFGMSLSFVSITAAMCITVGKTSFDDYDLLTSSFGWISFEPRLPPIISIALFEITSFAFMFDCVPDPVYHTTNGKWSSSLPYFTSSAALTIASAFFYSNPKLIFAIAAHFLRIPNALITGRGILSLSPPILKFIKDLYVWAPQ